MRWAGTPTRHVNIVSIDSLVIAQDSGFPPCGNPGVTPTPNLVLANGSGNLTFLWEQTGSPSDSGPFTCNAPAAQNPTWGGGSVCDGDNNDENWRVTITDNVFGTVLQSTITVRRNWISTQ